MTLLQSALPGLETGVREVKPCWYCVGLGTIEATDIFCGAGGSSLGLEFVCCPYCGRSLIRVTQAINHWDLAVEAHNANFPHADHDVHDVQEIPPSRFRRTQLLWVSPECFPAGTLVLTASGLRPIEDVEVGDLVLTHRNRWRRVTATMRGFNETVLVRGHGHPGIEMTPGHPIWTCRRRGDGFEEPQWVAAREISNGHYWRTPASMGELPVPPVPGRGMRFSEQFWWMVGRWLGDGTVRLRDKGSEITICCGHHEAFELAKRLRYAHPRGARAAAGELRWRERKIRTATLFETGHDGLARWLVEHFGRHAHGKTIPAWALTMPAEWRRALLEGYVTADGSDDGRKVQTATVSRRLALGVRLLAESLGQRVSISVHRHNSDVVEGRQVTSRPVWHVNWLHVRKRDWCGSDGEHSFLRIREVQPGRKHVEVFNLSVAEDESYVAEGIVVHNCVNHTNCKGKRDDSPEAQRSRATFKDIVRFTAHHRYDVVIVENVVEARLWCEHEDCACGAAFDTWFRAMLDEGYEGQIVYFNSQFALPTPQSRDRMYVIFWRRGVPQPNLDFRPLSWCSNCEAIVRGMQTWKPASRGSARETVSEWGRYGAQYVYTCPNADCGQPVSPAVIGARSIIDFSLPIERIGDKPARACSTCGRRHPVACNTRRRIRVGWETVGRRAPHRASAGGDLYERDGCARVWAIDSLVHAVGGSGWDALVTPAGSQDAKARPAGEPMHAVTGSERLAMVMRAGGQSVAARDIGAPVGTITAHDRQVGLVMQTGGPTGSGRNPRSTGEPTGTVMPESHAALVTQEASSGLPVSGTGGPDRITAGQAATGKAMPSFTFEDMDRGLLVYNGMPGFVRALGDTAGTVTTRDKQALLIPYFRTGVARPLDQPAGTVTTHDREALVISDADIDDSYLRMLQWQELLRAQAMHRLPGGGDYLLTARRRDGRGRWRELSSELRVRMIGNAVSSPVATMFGWAAFAALR